MIKTKLRPEDIVCDYFTRNVAGRLIWLGRGTAAELEKHHPACEAAGFGCCVPLPMRWDGTQKLDTPVSASMETARGQRIAIKNWPPWLVRDTRPLPLP